MRTILVIFLLLCAGCAIHRPGTANWRVVKENTAVVLIPPGLKQSNAVHADNIDLFLRQVDLMPPIRIQVVSAIRTGTPSPEDPVISASESNGGLEVTLKSDESLIGYETAWYSIAAKPRGTGFTIQTTGAERHIKNETEQRPQPAKNYLTFPADAAFYRLFYKSNHTAFTALVLAASSLAELDREGRLLDAAESSCQSVTAGWCIEIPRGIAINPMIPVTVNGAETMVNWGSNIASVIRGTQARQPSDLPPHLVVKRPFKGRLVPVDFDPHSQAILDLFLAGGETISWSR